MLNRDPRQRQASLFCLLVLLLAAGLRLWHVRHGLPDFLEEAIPFKQALEMWGWNTGQTDLNPHFFNYPTLSIYLHFTVQKLFYACGQMLGLYHNPSDYWLLYQLDPTTPVVVARLIGIGCDLATIVAVWSLGERLRKGAGLLAAVYVACMPTMIVTSRSIYTDPVMTAFAMWSLERMLAYRQHGGWGRLAASLALLGLAAGAKYTAGLLVLPLAWILWARHGWRGLAWWPAAAAGCLTVFLVSSPYVVFDFSSFWSDFSFERRHMAEGHLGTLGRHKSWVQLFTVIKDLGWVGSSCLLGSLGLTLSAVRRHSQRPELALWLFLLPNLLSVAFFRMSAIRYLVPILPGAALLASLVAVTVSGRFSGRQRILATLLLATALLAQPIGSGFVAASRGGQSTQMLAREWCEQNLDRSQILVQESYGALIRNDLDLDIVQRHPAFPAASEPVRQRFLDSGWFRSLNLPMAASGNYTITVQAEDGSQVKVNVFPHASDINQVFYSPALYRGVDFFLTSSAIRGRYAADPERYAAQNTWYGLLDQYGERVATFAPAGGILGPHIIIYHLGDRLQDLLVRDFPPLAPYWWAHAVPHEFRQRIDELFAASFPPSGGAVQLPDGLPAVWVRGLEEPFTRYIVPFLAPLSRYLNQLGRYPESRRTAAAILGMLPRQGTVCLIFSQSCRGMGDWGQARRAVEHTLRLLNEQKRDHLPLRLEHARLLKHDGEFAAARAELNHILAAGSRDADVIRQAQHLMDDL
ncbi:MAG: glycosyltransferase family 39 protein [bacterium]